mgnify:CR=1 FL=1
MNVSVCASKSEQSNGILIYEKKLSQKNLAQFYEIRKG